MKSIRLRSGLIGLGIIIGVLGIGIGVYIGKSKKWGDPRGQVKPIVSLDLEKYDFDNLKTRGGKASELKILGPIKAIEDRRKTCRDPKFCVKEIKFQTRKIVFLSDGKKVSGMMNYFPEKSSLSPVIIMVRGYADKPGYYPGSGSYRAADKLAEAGYATISLDFLGYADSDGESTDMLEARFHKVNELMDLIATVKNLPWVDKNKIGIWAHSNGGQIAISALEVTGQHLPTVLWAPMTNPFPQSVLDTASTNDDGGTAVQVALTSFQQHYDARRYAFENYFSWVKAPILIQQGTSDVWCKVEWQQAVVDRLHTAGKTAKLSVYQGNDHNFNKDWDKVLTEDLRWWAEEFR